MMAVDVNDIDCHVRVTHVPTQRSVGMVTSGRSMCVIHILLRIRGVPIRLDCMIVMCLPRLWIILNLEGKEAVMIGQTYRGYVDVAITKNTIVTAPKGVGVNKVLAWGKRPTVYLNVKKTPNVRNLLRYASI
jgi:hypothetical protein